ncbi:MAG: ferritin-like domain-containing protein [Chitinophagaceae bacterium]|jgi:rubrerythrin
MQLNHKKLVKLLQKAYSAEKAACYAYQGHAASIKNPTQKKEIYQIELDEWHHRACVLQIMQEYNIPISKWYELKFAIIGKTISISCHVIGWFMPFYFAGSLESGNVCEYFVMMQHFNSLGIKKHHEILYEMGMKEKEHEVYFLSKIKHNKLLPFFEKIFNWGKQKSFNDVNLDNKYPIDQGIEYCKRDK